MSPKVGCVVLTMGTRPAELDRSVQSLLAQTGVETEIVVVGNGWDPVNIPAGVATHFLPDNIGATAGRNAGAAVVQGDYLFFLDDDAQLPTPTTLARLIATIGPDTNAALVQPRVIDYNGVSEPKRRVPRLRAGDVNQSGLATSLWEGGVAIRRDVFEKSQPKGYVIDDQSADELKIIMRALYYQYSKNQPFDVPGQVNELNKK